LHCSLVQFDVDTRRRFERLPIHNHLRELRFPTLDTLLLRPGEWFSDARPLSTLWGELKSLTLPYYFTLELLRRLTEMPFWNSLTALNVDLQWGLDQRFLFLRDRLPDTLRELHVYSGEVDAHNRTIEMFSERIARMPLQRLHLRSIPLRAETLGQVLDGTNQWKLEALSLSNCGITEDHARVLAESPGLKSLRFLNLSSNRHFGSDAARILFSSVNLNRLTHLNLYGTRIGTEGVIALAEAKGWDRLRSLDLLAMGLNNDGLRSLLASPTLQNLTFLTAGGGYDRQWSLGLSPDVASRLTRLPHLASLNLVVNSCDPQAKQALSTSESLAWVSIDDQDEYDVQTEREKRAPECWPPLDEALEPVCGVWR
jgi:hypothetical protein